MTALGERIPAWDAGRVGERAVEPVPAERFLAIVTLTMLGMRTSVFHGITLGMLLAAFLAPLWWPSIQARRGGRLLLVLGTVGLFTGLILTWLSSATHALNTRQITVDSALLVQLFLGVFVVFWARELLSVRALGIAYGVGLLLQGVVDGSWNTGNPWKTFWAVTLAILLLSWTAGSRRAAGDVIVLLVLASVSATQDSRSYAAAFAIAALLRLWELRPMTLSRRRSSVLNGVAIIALVVGVYNLIQNLLVSGYLGTAAQQKTIGQIQTSGSLILGGRPELTATLALMRDDIWGHGVGVLVTYHDLTVAKSAMAGINIDPNNGYVERFMFGGDIELHSTFGDLWTHYGIPGLVLSAVIVVQVFRYLVTSLSRRTGAGLVYFLATWTLWNMFFSPYYSAITTLTLMLGLAAPLRVRRDAGPTPDDEPALTTEGTS